MTERCSLPSPDRATVQFPAADRARLAFPGVDRATVRMPTPPFQIVAGFAMFSGSGALSVVETFAIADAVAAFTGEGTATGATGVAMRALLSGVGAATAAVAVPHTPRFAGAGALTAGSAVATRARWSGAGALSAAVSASADLAADFSGSGSLSAMVSVEGGEYPLAANFSGEGSAWGWIKQTIPLDVAFYGEGSLTARSAPALTAAASGAGTATAEVVEVERAAAAYSGSGSTTVKVVPAIAARFSGEGSSTADMRPAVEPQGMRLAANNGSNWGDWYNKWGLARTMSADPAYPGSTVTSNALVISGSGTGRIELGVGFNNEWGNDGVQCRAVRAGVILGTITSTADNKKAAAGTLPGITVTEGDQITLEAYQKYGANTLLAAHTYLRFIPG